MGVNERAIVEAVASLPMVGNEEGLIPAFGLYLTRHYADYYNRVSFTFLHGQERIGKPEADRAAESLIEAGHVCAFNTFGGIMMSQEWDAVVAPMIATRRDWVSGITAIVNTLGWGRWRIDKLDADDKVDSGRSLTIRCDNSYESEGYLRDYPLRDDGGVCFLATGGAAGIMNLLYHGDITARPAHTEAYYREIFQSGDDRFIAREVECRAHGAEACVWTARRASEWDGPHGR